MRGFPGFPDGKVPLVPVPDPFFTDLLPLIDNLAELKATLFAIWALARRRENETRYLRAADWDAALPWFEVDQAGARSPREVLWEGIERAVARGSLLEIVVHGEDGEEVDRWYVLNTPRGRELVARIERGEVPPEVQPAQVHLTPRRPNIFTLYEQNIGLLQPLIAEELREAEQIYPSEWIEEAFRIAAERNVRRWSYVRRILERWASEGREDRGQDRQDSEEGRRYIDGEFADYIQH